MRAEVPIAEVDGLVTQTIEASWNNLLQRLTDPPVVPQGWSTEYYSGEVLLDPAPRTVREWNSVTRVKTTGSYYANGAENGRQILISTYDAPPPVVASAFQGDSAGDGWDAFFDQGYSKVYNIHHHTGPATVMCRNLDDAQPCNENWPLDLASGATNIRSTGIIDSVTSFLWQPTTVSGMIGWDCVDTQTSAVCDPATVSTDLEVSNDEWGGANSHGDPVTVGRKMYALAYTAFDGVQLSCLDMASGALCAGALLTGIGTYEYGGLAAVGTRLYALAGADQPLECFDTTLVDADGQLEPCGGSWPVQTSQGSNGRVIGTPSADGVIRSVCADGECFTLDGTPITAANAGPLTLPAGYLAYHPQHPASCFETGSYSEYSGFSRKGPRVAWVCDGSQVCCWDMSTDSTCSGGFPLTDSTNTYAVTFDPNDDNCIWTNGDDGVIRNYRIDTGELGCTAGAPRVQFKASVSIPRLGCEESSRVFEYRHFKLLSPTSDQYTSATLTVKDSNGVALADWIDLPIPADGFIDLSSLTVAEAGTTPTFDIVPLGLIVPAPVPTAELKIVTGTPPQLCWTLHAAPEGCPDLPGFSGLDLGTLVLADASYADDNTTFDFPQQSYDPFDGDPPVPPVESCGATISGTAYLYTGELAAGVPVALLDAEGAPILHPATGDPVTALTGADGTFSFPVWGGHTYYVQAGSTQSAEPLSLTVLTADEVAYAEAGVVLSPALTVQRGDDVRIKILMWQEVDDFTLVGSSADGVDCFTATVPIEDINGTITQTMDLAWERELRQITDLPVCSVGRSHRSDRPLAAGGRHHPDVRHLGRRSHRLRDRAARRAARGVRWSAAGVLVPVSPGRFVSVLRVLRGQCGARRPRHAGHRRGGLQRQPRRCQGLHLAHLRHRG